MCHNHFTNNPFTDNYKLSRYQQRSNMIVECFDGPVTETELRTFTDFISQLQPADDNINNTWAQGASGEAVKAIGMVYQMSLHIILLDHMIRFCDKLLSIRNDLAPHPIGQHVIWTGTVAPVWPNNVSVPVISTGAEQGDAVGHLAYCARLILQNASVGDLEVPDGDPYSFGRTYAERARRYVKEAERTVDEHLFPLLLNLTDGERYYFSSESPQRNKGIIVPWNQHMMFNYAFQHLSIAQRVLGNNRKADVYKRIVKNNIRWFFSDEAELYLNNKGNYCYRWNYHIQYSKEYEDSNHAALVIDGLYRAYYDDFFVSEQEMTYFANTFVDLMIMDNGKYAGRVDGTSANTGKALATNYIRHAFLLLAEFRPDSYERMVSADVRLGKKTNNFQRVSRVLWVKNRRFVGSIKRNDSSNLRLEVFVAAFIYIVFVVTFWRI